MPVYKTITVDRETQIFIWKILESEEQLQSQVELNDFNKIRIGGMKSEMHRRGFLSVRKLLRHIGYTDFDLNYDQMGKPHLKDGRHISISHSHEFSAIAVSNRKIGIDIEKQREKIIGIADKFIDSEFQFLNKNDPQTYIEQLTVIWCTKEAIFKIRSEQGISFKVHIQVAPFKLPDLAATATLIFEDSGHLFNIHFEKFESFNIVYAFEN